LFVHFVHLDIVLSVLRFMDSDFLPLWYLQALRTIFNICVCYCCKTQIYTTAHKKSWNMVTKHHGYKNQQYLRFVTLCS
jgi:hypothetical protein